MESLKDFQLALIPITLVILSLISVNGQIGTPCTISMVSSITPCVSFITGSTSNGSLPPPQSCCDTFKALLGNSMDCACLIVTGNVPIQLPINRTLALSLPQACNSGGVPLQCKASGSPLAAPGPALLAPTLGPTLGPTPSPTSASALSPTASKAVATAPSPQSGTADDMQPESPSVEPESPSVEPESPSVEPEAPTQSTTPSQIGRSTPLPSASSLSYVSPPSLLLIVLGIVVFKSY